jgi:hypothetical protein
MNQDLPKPMLDALAREATPTDHPSSDLLAAFAENALSGSEHRRITEHVARCTECREVAFLAVGTAETPVQPQTNLEAAQGGRRRWTPRLVWGISIAAGVLVVASAVMLWRTESVPTRQQMAANAIPAPAAQPAQKSQPTQESKGIAAAPQTTVEAVATVPIVRPQAKTARVKPPTPKGAETLGVGASAGIIADASPVPAKADSVRPNAETVAIAAESAKVAPAPPAPQVNSFAYSSRSVGGPVTGGSLELNKAGAARSLRSAHPQWRITSEGHLEHLTSDGWSRVLANQPATFRVVSVIGNQVWVGGSGGALFRSRDDGQNWEPVSLPTPNGTATIVSIQFDDTQHGTVTTNAGTHCATADGGGSWNCE